MLISYKLILILLFQYVLLYLDNTYNYTY